MKITLTDFKDLLVIERNIFTDNRGYFNELYNQAKLSEQGFDIKFVQDNNSYSYPNVIRGLHAQHSPSQGKLVSVVSGEIWDVAVDLRTSSSTFGEYFAINLSASNGNCLWIPAGFAHGFCVMGDVPANIIYKVDCSYNPNGEIGIIWNDKELNIDWPIKDPILSERDLKMSSFLDYKKNVIFS